MTAHMHNSFISAPVIGITGRKQSGKNWFARSLAQGFSHHGYRTKEVSFAEPIKAACAAIFGWDLAQLEDEDFKSKVDPRFGITPRKAMQLMGTEFGRDMVLESIWVDIAMRKIYDNHRDGFITIITDLRFDNEHQAVASLGGKVVQVVNPWSPPPEDGHRSEAGITAAPDFLVENYYRKDEWGGIVSPNENHQHLITTARTIVAGLMY